MTTTHEIHNQVNMDPAAYRYVGGFDSDAGDPGARGGQPAESFTSFGVTVMAYSPVGADKQALRELLRNSDSSRFMDRYQCDHCGAYLRYVAVLRHLPTGQYIAVGEQCLNVRFSLASKADFDKMHKASAAERAEMKTHKACVAFLANCSSEAIDMLAVSKTFQDRNPNAADDSPLVQARNHNIVADIRRRFHQYGSVSEKQIALVERILGQQIEKITNPRPVELKATAPIGRQTVEGVILKLEWRENDFGGRLVMAVKVTTDQGVYLVWGTCPSSIDTAKKGDTVKFTASFKSTDDASFAVYQRPTGATVTAKAE